MKRLLYVFCLLIVVSCTANVSDEPETPLPPPPLQTSGDLAGMAIDYASYGFANPHEKLVYSAGEVSVNNQDFVYKTFYLWANDTWVPLDYDQDALSGKWVEGTATRQLRTNASWLASYGCSMITDNGELSGWDCNDNLWMLRKVESECILLSGNSTENRISIVFVADDYNLTNQGILSFHERANAGIEYLSMLEPFNSYADNFNFYIVNASLDMDCQLESSRQPCIDSSTDLASACPNTDLVYVLSDEIGDSVGWSVEGLAQLTPFKHSRNEALADPHTNIDLLAFDFARHFAGAFAGLASEDFSHETSADIENLPNCDTFGCPTWCNVTQGSEPDPSVCSALALEQECLDEGCVWENGECRLGLSGQNFGSECERGHGCYQGCGNAFNAYRSFDGCTVLGGSCEGLEYDREFSPRSRHLLEQKIKSFE